MTKEMSEITSMDMANVMGSFISTELDAFENLYNELEEKDKEIERLNNIINGMEKFFKYAYDNEVRPLNDRKVSVWTICLDKLQELKGSNDNDNDK